MALGAYDQTTPAFTPAYAATSAAYGNDRAFVARAERVLGRSASIFQLPYVPFPEYPPVFGMVDYDHLRGYVHSDSLRWSYGGVKGRESEWQSNLVTQPLDVMVAGMAAAEFDGLYVDRAGYPDEATQLESGLIPILGNPLFESEDGRLAMFDLRPIRRRLNDALPPPQLRALRAAILHPPAARFASGFYGEERDASSTGHWATGEAELVITNPRRRAQTVRLAFGMDSLDPASHVTVSGLGNSDVSIPARGPDAVSYTHLTLPTTPYV